MYLVACYKGTERFYLMRDGTYTTDRLEAQGYRAWEPAEEASFRARWNYPGFDFTVTGGK